MNQQELFKTKVVPGKPGSGNLFDEKIVLNDGPVKCLGLEFENNEARRAHFTEELRKKLQNPEFRRIEGFPIGEDEDILNLSDPPYYTACPNPWIADFIDEWENQKPEKPADYHYHREPFAADVSEGKNDPIYNAHSYHTKVPHKAIMRYILHYTEPGDIVFDGFCGTGMTGVAAQMCGDRDVAESLGYQVKPDGTILQEETDEDGKKVWRPISKLGSRKIVLNDLSPVATFISSQYNKPFNVLDFDKEFLGIYNSLNKEFSKFYSTIDPENGKPTRINFILWSDVLICSSCSEEFSFWEGSIDLSKSKMRKNILCPHCSTELKKKDVDRIWQSDFDPYIGEIKKTAKQIAVLINYSSGKSSKFKAPDTSDHEMLSTPPVKILSHDIPTNIVPSGNNTDQPRKSHGFSHVHHFYTSRHLAVFSRYFELARNARTESFLKFVFTSAHQYMNKLCRLHVGNYFSRKGGLVDKPLSGTLYMPSLSVETNPIERLKLRARIERALLVKMREGVISTSSSSIKSQGMQNSCDYIFVDPPFGANIMYCEVNFLWESWLRVVSDWKSDCVHNEALGKTYDYYSKSMLTAFKDNYRRLKPGRWMTVEFSNTKANMWNLIQSSLQEAGFVIANISAIDKQKGSFKSVTTPTAVKQDLVISAYKPNGGFEERFQQEAQTEEGVWDFIRTHLKYLPVIKKQGYDLVAIPERDPRILYDQVVTYYVRKGHNVPIDSQDFQLGLSQRFSERDGMYFLPEQVAEYDRKKMLGGGRPIQQSLFVSDEASAIEWLRNLLRDKPQSFQDINPLFMKEIGGWSKNEVGLELSTLLEQNFLPYDGKGPVPDQIHSYLSTNWKDMRNLTKNDPALVAKAKGRWYVPDPNKAGDLEKLREKALLKEFEEYKQAKKKLKIFRLEAVRAGFKKLWQQRNDEAYKTIIAVAEKIPNKVLEEDPKLLMWYDQAVTRVGDVN